MERTSLGAPFPSGRSGSTESPEPRALVFFSKEKNSNPFGGPGQGRCLLYCVVSYNYLIMCLTYTV